MGSAKIIMLGLIAKVYLLQTSFSLYLCNRWTDFHKLSCTEHTLLVYFDIYETRIVRNIWKYNI